VVAAEGEELELEVRAAAACLRGKSRDNGAESLHPFATAMPLEDVLYCSFAQPAASLGLVGGALELLHRGDGGEVEECAGDCGYRDAVADGAVALR
jgi:hypothetical protein